MASQAATPPLPAPAQIVKALAGAAPSELSNTPLLGILGVVMGAGIVTLAGRFISLGTADLKGSLGIGYDDGAWIGSAFNIALMFIGPFTVYLGGLLGARRVLLLAATSFTVICALLPFVHSYSLLITCLVLAGLTSGTFYPLTLTFALRNIPPRFLPFTLAFYATFVDGAVNLAPSLYGFFRDRLSFEWMFWSLAVLTPLMALCIYYGIPATPAAHRKGPAPSFAGFLYASIGFALLFAALDQGQRLDWWRSGLFAALITGAAIFLLGSLVRRLRMPNPLVDLPYLRLWNTQLLGIGLMLFRFSLLATIILVPQALGIHGFEADQIGPAVLWTGLPQFLIAFVAALLLLQGLDSRLLMAAGFACIAFGVILNAQLTSAWSASNFYRTELLIGVGQSFAFIGLVATIVLQAIFSGGLARPQDALTFSAFFHIVRLLGGEIGVSYMLHFVAVREQLHSNLLGLHVEKGSPLSDLALHQLRALSAFLGITGGHGARCRGGRCPCSAASVYAQPHRRIFPGGLGMRRRLAAHRHASSVSAQLQRSWLSGGSSRPTKGPLMKTCVTLFLAGITLCTAGLLRGQEAKTPAPRHLTLEEAVQLALRHNHVVRIAGFKIEEKERAKDVARSAYYPLLRNDSSVLRLTETQYIGIAQGSLGTIAGYPSPPESVILNQGGYTLITSGTGLTQPLTELLKIKPANDIAAADLAATRGKAHQVENEVALRVHQLYYRVLIAQSHHEAALARIKAAEELQKERISQVKFGSALQEEAVESQAQSLEAKQDLLTTELQLSDLTFQLNDAIGLPLSTQLALDPGVPQVEVSCERGECLKLALGSHPEVIEAQAEVEKASAAVRLAKREYIPNVEAFARYSYQDNVPFLARNFGTFGVHLGYDLFDGGRRGAAIGESKAKLSQAEENLARVKEEVEVRVQTAYNKLDRTKQMLDVAEELLKLRTESSRVTSQQLKEGAALNSQADAAAAKELDAKTGLLQAQLDYTQARDELQEAMGQTPE